MEKLRKLGVKFPGDYPGDEEAKRFRLLADKHNDIYAGKKPIPPKPADSKLTDEEWTNRYKFPIIYKWDNAPGSIKSCWSTYPSIGELDLLKSNFDKLIKNGTITNEMLKEIQ